MEHLHILVVDDEPQITRVLRTTLAANGYDIRVANDGEMALEIMKDWSPNLIITDLMMPNLDAANIAYQMVKALTDAVPVGPILIGPARPAHILIPSVTARGVLNMTAVAAVEAQERAGRQQPSLFT